MHVLEGGRLALGSICLSYEFPNGHCSRCADSDFLSTIYSEYGPRGMKYILSSEDW